MRAVMWMVLVGLGCSSSPAPSGARCDEVIARLEGLEGRPGRASVENIDPDDMQAILAASRGCPEIDFFLQHAMFGTTTLEVGPEVARALKACACKVADLATLDDRLRRSFP